MFFTTFSCYRFIYYFLVIMYSDIMNKREEIREKIEKLEKEAKEIKQMKNDANSYGLFREIITDVSKYKKFD